MDNVAEASLDFAEREFREFRKKYDLEKAKEKQAKRAKLLKVLRISFNEEQHQFLSDFLISLIPIILTFLYDIYRFLRLVSFNFLNSSFLFLVKSVRLLWVFIKQSCLFFYKQIFIFLQNVINYPLILFFFFFEKKITIAEQQKLKDFVLWYNAKLSEYYFYFLIPLRRKITYKQLFQFRNVLQFWSFVKHIFYSILLEFMSFGRVQSYTDIFQWMALDEIRTEVIAEILMHRKDMGHEVHESDYRYYDDPRKLARVASMRVFSFHFGFFFGLIVIAFFGALPHVVFSSFLAGTVIAFPYMHFDAKLSELNSNSWYEAIGAWTAVNSDWLLFETWFDSVPYFQGHQFRHYADPILEKYVIEEHETQGNPRFYADDTIYDDPDQPSKDPRNLGYYAIIIKEDLMNDEENFLKTTKQRNRFGEPLQFYEIPYATFAEFMKKHWSLNTDFSSFFANEVLYEDRRFLYWNYSRYKYLDKIYDYPGAKEEAPYHVGRKLQRVFKYRDLFPNVSESDSGLFMLLLSKKELLDQMKEIYPELPKTTLQGLAKKKPYYALSFEHIPAYHDYQFLNSPFYRMYEIWDIEHHDCFDDDEDDLDYMENENYFIGTTDLVFFETRVTLILLDVDYYILRLFAKYQMRIEAGNFYFYYYLEVLFLWLDRIIDFSRYTKEFLMETLD